MTRTLLIAAMLIQIPNAKAAVERSEPGKLLPKQASSSDSQVELWRQRRLLLKKLNPTQADPKVRPVAAKEIPAAKTKPAQ